MQLLYIVYMHYSSLPYMKYISIIPKMAFWCITQLELFDRNILSYQMQNLCPKNKNMMDIGLYRNLCFLGNIRFYPAYLVLRNSYPSHSLSHG